MTNQDAIPLDLALKAVRRAKEMEHARCGQEYIQCVNCESLERLARATYGAMLDYIKWELEYSGGVRYGNHAPNIQPFLAALIAHLDIAVPEWRKEK